MLRAAVLAAFVIVCGCQKPRDVVTARQLMQARNDGERVVLSGLVRNPRIQTPSGANSYTSFDVLDGTGHVRWEEVPDPRIETADDALVRPLVVTTCDLDHAIVHGRVPLGGPFPLGHEFVAEVVETGDAVGRFGRGD